MLLLLDNEMKEQIFGIKIEIGFVSPEAQFLVPDWEYIVDSGRPAHVAWRAGTTTGTKSFATGFRFRVSDPETTKHLPFYNFLSPVPAQACFHLSQIHKINFIPLFE